MIKKCSNCYWCQEKEHTPNLKQESTVRIESHIGCYVGNKWRKWISKKKIDIPNECPDWKEIPEIPY